MQLLQRKEVWVPTWQGWAAIVAIPGFVLFLFVTATYPFLAANEPNGQGYLVVEGWMSKSQLGDNIDLLSTGEYDAVLVAGGPISQGSYLKELYPQHETLAEVGASQFRSLGVENVHAVPRPQVQRDRTYHSGLAIRRWLAAAGTRDARIDVVSLGPHARRSWILFGAALSDVADVGVLAIRPANYDPDRWWATSAGVRTLLSESIAYCYAKFLFYPDPKADLRAMLSEGSL